MTDGKIMRLNLGCGKDHKEGYINIDKISVPGVDMAYDLEKLPYPFKNNSVDEIYVSHILEHLDLPVKDFLEEAKRILKTGGIIKLRVPIGLNAMSIFHKKHFGVFNFSATDTSDLEQIELWKGWRVDSLKLGYLKCGKTWFINRFVEKLINKRTDIYEHSFLRYLFPANELIVKITKI